MVGLRSRLPLPFDLSLSARDRNSAVDGR
jgi:hypothetical protein